MIRFKSKKSQKESVNKGVSHVPGSSGRHRADLLPLAGQPGSGTRKLEPFATRSALRQWSDES